MKNSKFIISLFLLSFLITSIGLAQDVPTKLAAQVKRNAQTKGHITTYYTGQIERLTYNGFRSDSYLNGIIFRKSDGKLIKLWINGYEGTNIKPYLKLREQVEVKVTGDPILLKKLLYRDSKTKALEKELKDKISGAGFLKEINTASGAYVLNDEKPKERFPVLNTAYETKIGIGVKEIVKLKSRRALIILENGDSLDHYSLGTVKKQMDNNRLSYLRPIRSEKEGYLFKTNNTFRMSAGNLIKQGNTIYRVPIMNQQGVLIDNKAGTFDQLLSDQRGLINQMQFNSDGGMSIFKFSSKNAQELKSFVERNEAADLTLYYKSLTPDGHAKSKKENMLYAICSALDTLYTDDYYSFVNVNNHYNTEVSTYEGVITKIHYPEKVNKTSLIKTPQTIETGFRSLLVNDKVYLQIRDVLALSLADIISEGKQVSIAGWVRKTMAEEINTLGYTIMIPSKITIDGKTFSNTVDLKTAL